jgi:hypothetical protein
MYNRLDNDSKAAGTFEFEDDLIDLDAGEKASSVEQSIEAMKKRYTPSMMINVLHGLFPSEEIGRFAFQTDFAIIFPPVSDHMGSEIFNIQKVLQDALANRQISEKDLQHKSLIFPLVQEHNAFNPQWQDLSFFPIWGYLSQVIGPRNHWVTLHYNPKTKVASLIDSRPGLNSYFYSTTPLQDSLQSALSPFGLAPARFQALCQGVQYDDIHCGAWTALNIETLACGVDINYLMNMVKLIDKDAVIRHMIDKTFHQKKSNFIKPTNHVFDEVEEFNISKPDIMPLLESALRPEEIARALVLRESLSLNGRKISLSNPIGPNDLDEIFSELHETYQGIANTRLARKDLDLMGYCLHDPGRSSNNLLHIGFNRQEIDALSLKDMLVYDAIIFNIISVVHIAMIKEYLTHLASFEESSEEFMGQMSQYYLSKIEEYKQSLFPIIKEFIKNNMTLQESALVLKDNTCQGIKSMKTAPLLMVDLISLRHILENYPKSTYILFGNYNSIGMAQAITIKTKHFIQKPEETIKMLLMMMKASNWNISTTTLMLCSSNIMKRTSIPASMEPAIEVPPQNASYWEGFVALLKAMLDYIINFAKNLMPCLNYKF